MCARIEEMMTILQICYRNENKGGEEEKGEEGSKIKSWKIHRALEFEDVLRDRRCRINNRGYFARRGIKMEYRGRFHDEEMGFEYWLAG